MKYLQKSFTVGQPSQVTCCEGCVYGRGSHHAIWCPVFLENYRKLRASIGEIIGEAERRYWLLNGDWSTVNGSPNRVNFEPYL